MNKYIEALDYLKKHLDSKHDLKKVEVLQELVDKATPKKAVKLPEIEYGYTHECPVCHQYVGTVCESEEGLYVEENEYCCECGQKLDWSDENVD